MGKAIQTRPIMQKALGDQWHDLPLVLQRHYMTHSKISCEVGWLTIDYPRWLQWPSNALKMLGALVNRRAVEVPTTVCKRRLGEVQLWQRSCIFADGQEIKFSSRMTYAGGKQIIEYVNSLLGVRMEVHTEQGHLYYRGVSYVLKLGRFSLNIPNALALGMVSIEELAIDDEHFSMDFQLRHPLFGLLYQYSGRFKVAASVR